MRTKIAGLLFVGVLIVGVLAALVCWGIINQHKTTPPGLDGKVMWLAPDLIEAGILGEEVNYGDTEGAVITIFIDQDDNKFKFGQKVKVKRYE